MKQLIYFIFAFLTPFFSAVAQQTTGVDQEKLIEFYQSQRYTEAAAYLQTVYGTETEDPKQLAQIAYTNLMAGNLSAAEKTYQKLYAQQPNSMPVLFSLASISVRRGDDVKAMGFYKKVVEIDSMNFNVYKQMAGLIDNPVSPEKIAYLKKANTLNPLHPDVAFDLATAYTTLKKNDSAYHVLDTALTADSANLSLLKAKMPVCIGLLKFDETVKTGIKLLTYGDSSSYVLNNMGRVYFLTKEYQKAIEMYQAIERLQQPTESTFYYTSLCYRELKNYKKAEDYIKLSISEGISKFMANYYQILGEINEKEGLVKNANAAYHKSLDYENTGGVYYNLGLINDFKMDNKKAAMNYYKLYLASKPDPERRKEVIEYVKMRIADLKKAPSKSTK
jgi:tetratricopeptide (TPR) repeat protein